MFSAAFSFLIAIVVTAALTPLVRRAALAVGAVDHPSARRVHTRKIPRAGGIAIVFGFFVPLLVLFAMSTQTARIFFASPRVAAALVVGSLLVAGLGLYDDIVGVGAKAKLTVQVLAASVVFAAGLRISQVTLPLVGIVELGWLAYPATVLWITAIINALNLIDGLDGLAAGVAFFACVTNFVVATIGGNVLIALLSATLGGAIIGFLFYNFNPARIFMGDSGSMFLGFALACASMLGAGTQKSPTLVAILVPLIALGLPIMDMLLAIARRFLERRSIFAPDRGHIHHRLIDAGLTHRRAVLVLYAMSLAFTFVALAIYFGRSWQIGLALLGLGALVIGVVRFVRGFNRTVTLALQRTGDLFSNTLRRAVPATLTRVAAARGASELPGILQWFASEHGLLAVEILPAPESTLPPFRWETDDASHGLREAVCAKFPVTDAVGATHELQFYWDSPDGTVSARSEVLLQLVADAAESLMQRVGRARAASATGRLRPVS